MEKLFQILRDMLICGQNALLISILAESGSAPRGAGAHMLVGQAGWLWGSIGGGSMEHQAEILAQELLNEGRSLLKEYNLSQDLGMICGGEATVFYRFIAAEDPDMQELCASALRQIAQNRDVWLVTRLEKDAPWQTGLYSREEGLQFIGCDLKTLQPCFARKPLSLYSGGAAYYVEPVASAGRVLIFGGGHVAQALAPLLSKLDFACWVMDDRPQFATTGFFPEAKRVICGSYEDIGRHIKIQPADFAVVMTHGHASDYVVQKQVMRSAPAYIGVIGSKNKVKLLGERLAEEGFSPEQIASVHAPIGLSIKAETPAEIAVSIAAELIQVRAGQGRRGVD